MSSFSIYNIFFGELAKSFVILKIKLLVYLLLSLQNTFLIAGAF
jgi:hypothetical protein